MMYFIKINRTTLVFLCVFILQNSSFSQIQKKEVFVKYESKDSTQSNINSILILYKDNSYLNFGLFNNAAEKEWYVWYSSGRWINIDSKILLKSYETISNSELIKKEILTNYKRRPDYTLIEKYYEFVHVNYNDYVLLKKEDEIYDDLKKTNYKVVN